MRRSTYIRRLRGCLLVGLLATLIAATGCDRRKAIEQYNRGVRFVEAGQPMAAIAAFREALALREEFPEANNSLGYVFNQLKQYDEAAKQFAIAAENEKYKDRHLAYLNLGTAYSNAERYDDAIAALKKSVELRPTADAYYTLGQVYAVQEQVSRAIEALRESLALDPDRIEAMRADPVLDRLREKPEFVAFLESESK